ncbi:MAG: TolC family protein, partial [Luteimonas sp.]
AQPLSDMQAAHLALSNSPDLVAMRAKVGVADAQVFSAGLIADPQLSASIDHPAQADLVDGLTGSLGFDLMSLLGRGSRVEQARRQREQTQLEVGWNEWIAFNHVRTLVRRVVALERQVEMAREASDAAQTLYRQSARNVQIGDARLDDASVYQVGWIDAQDRALGLERQAIAARDELNTVLGLPPATVLTLKAPTVGSVVRLNPQALAQRAAEQRLDIRALRSGYAAQEQGVRLAVRESLPLPQLDVTRTRDTSAIWTSGLGIVLPLPLWNRNRGAIAVAIATRAQLSSEYIARLLQTRGDIAATIDDLQRAEAQRRALAEQLPALRSAARTVSSAAQRGDVPLTTYNTLRASLLDKELTLLLLEQAESEGEVALDTAVGQLLTETGQ